MIDVLPIPDCQFAFTSLCLDGHKRVLRVDKETKLRRIDLSMLMLKHLNMTQEQVITANPIPPSAPVEDVIKAIFGLK